VIRFPLSRQEDDPLPELWFRIFTDMGAHYGERQRHSWSRRFSREPGDGYMEVEIESLTCSRRSITFPVDHRTGR